MGSAQLRPLDESLAYIYCPACAHAGTPNVPLRRAMHQIICTINPGHQYTFEQLQRARADMTPMSAILTETPNPTSVAWKIFVAPNTKSVLEQKLAGRLHVTIGTMLDALADDQIIFITGTEADDLKKRGLNNGTQIVAALNSYAQLEKERLEAIKQLEQVRAMLTNLGLE